MDDLGHDGSAAPPRCPYLVGIGASAGGLDPLETFFDAMPPGTGVAFVVVQHLSPDFKSLMKELLGRHTKMAVHRVEDDMVCEPDAIYLIPPKKNMRVERGRLRLHDQDLSVGRSPQFSIDLFFESLAEDFGPRSVAVVLSGTGTDGSRGIRRVNEAGGLVLVQNPETAQFDGMPRAALATGSVHNSLAPDELARAIYDYVKRCDASDTDTPLIPGVNADGVLQEVIALLRSDGGVDFSHYRPTTIARRLSRRVSLTGHASITDYLELLSKSAEERVALRNDLLIGVTSFFRDAPAWQLLTDKALRPLVESKGDGAPLRAWVTACSTGEEVYTLAMLLREQMERQRKALDVKIFATDIDKQALERAAAGFYPASVVEDVGPDRLARFFLREGEGFRVRRQMREMVIFAEHNLNRDTPFTNIDLVSCRNALIYMEPRLQERVLTMLHFALRNGGTLFLGAAETPGALEREFTPLDAKWKLFAKRRDVVLRMDGRRPGMDLLKPIVARTPPWRPHPSSTPSPGTSTLVRAMRLLLATRDAACLVVGVNNEALHVYGKIEDYLSVPEGQGTTDVIKMVRDPLRLPLGAALHQARSRQEVARYASLPVDGKAVDMLVVHQPANDRDDAFTLVAFDASSRPLSGEQMSFSVEDHIAARVRDLERELQQTRENLQATIEELETTNEEHQATNEELLASNEELQSTNEELQSVNEELYTVNAEHQTKIQELTSLNNDLDNLLRTTQLITIFLDRDLRIRKFTPNARVVVNLAEHDSGRPIQHFTHNLDFPNLWDELHAAADDGRERECTVRTRAGKKMLMRVLPYLTNEKLDGVVLTLIELDILRHADNAPAASERLGGAGS